MGSSPGVGCDWKNSMPSSAGVLGVGGVGATGLEEDEPDAEPDVDPGSLSCSLCLA